MMDSQMPRNSQRDGEPALVDKDKERIKELEKQIDKLNKVVELSREIKSNIYSFGMATTIPDSLITLCDEIDEALAELKG